MINTIKRAAILIFASLTTIALVSCAAIDNSEPEKSANPVENVVASCPRKSITQIYSIAGPAIEGRCCTTNDLPNEVQGVLSKKSTWSRPMNIAQTDVQVMSSTTTCVRTDSLNAAEKAMLEISSSCNTFVYHEPTICACSTGCSCSQRGWTCNNCPGVPDGELPEVAEVQDSIGSRNIRIGLPIETSCGGPIPPIAGDG